MERGEQRIDSLQTTLGDCGRGLVNHEVRRRAACQTLRAVGHQGFLRRFGIQIDPALLGLCDLKTASLVVVGMRRTR